MLGLPNFMSGMEAFRYARGAGHGQSTSIQGCGSETEFAIWKRRTTKWRAGQELAAGETTPSKPSSSVTSRRPLLSPAKRLLEGKVFVIAASSREEFRLAAATLRAQIFHSYPQADVTLVGMDAVKIRVANDFLVNDLLKTRGKSEFSRLQNSALASWTRFCERRVSLQETRCQTSTVTRKLFATRLSSCHT